ncbi:MAG TPA: copper chaperone PCu(A)C [Limnochordales bacterium]
MWARPALAPAAGQGHDGMAGAVSALYMTLTNRGDREVRVVAVRTPVAHTAELHETRIEGMVARMQPVDAVPVPPGQQVRLQPGGLHVMLMGLRQDLKAGDRFPVTLVLDDGEEVAAEAVVREG